MDVSLSLSVCMTYSSDDSSKAGGRRNKLSLDLDFLNDEFGNDFYSTDEANVLQLERLAVQFY